MRNKAGIAFIFLGIILGCGDHKEQEKHEEKYKSVGAYYCVKVIEKENTCNCSGPRDFPNPLVVMFHQNARPDGSPSNEVDFTGGGLAFGGRLHEDDSFESYVDTYDTVDTNIGLITYNGLFTGTNGLVNYHETTGPMGDQDLCPSALEPCHLRIEYKKKACCRGDSGYNVIVLRGRKLTDMNEPCVNSSALQQDNLLFIAEP